MKLYSREVKNTIQILFFISRPRSENIVFGKINHYVN